MCDAQAAAIGSIDGFLLLGPLRHRGQQYNLRVADAYLLRHSGQLIEGPIHKSDISWFTRRS
ncbi:MAG: hypothetical protein DMF26_13710 [Verrucomicrobia bacterium]|nr:MAG: hypothetical protein DMF26_13710 [Verrucomicrobiota bacterium]